MFFHIIIEIEKIGKNVSFGIYNQLSSTESGGGIITATLRARLIYSEASGGD
jgi:hypothetical protein